MEELTPERTAGLERLLDAVLTQKQTVIGWAVHLPGVHAPEIHVDYSKAVESYRDALRSAPDAMYPQGCTDDPSGWCKENCGCAYWDACDEAERHVLVVPWVEPHADEAEPFAAALRPSYGGPIRTYILRPIMSWDGLRGAA